MADRRLPIARDRTKTGRQLGRPEVRIVPESARTARRLQNLAARLPARTPLPIAPTQHRRARIPRPARRRALQRGQQALAVGRIQCRPMQPRRAPQRLLRTPGAPPRASTHSPESSASTARPRHGRRSTPLSRGHSRRRCRRPPALLLRPLRHTGLLERLGTKPRRLHQPAQLAQLAGISRGQQDDRGPTRGDGPARSDAECDGPIAVTPIARAPWPAPHGAPKCRPAPDRAAHRVHADRRWPCSPVPCTSTKRPPVHMTTFMSTAARTSSS
jgi:hypothetical protein